ncbi:MAG: HNH endonuclease [bacterium]
MRAPPAKVWRRYLRSKAWKERRLEAIRRAGYRCQVCGRVNFDDREYQVHHRSYEHFGAERPEELMALCKRCHRRVSTW